MPIRTKKNNSAKKVKKPSIVKKELKTPHWPLFVLYSLGLLLAVSAALPAYIQSNFLEQYVSLRIVSLFFVVANMFTVTAIIIFPGVIRKLTNYFTTKIVLVLYGASLLGLTLVDSPAAAFLSIILFTISANLIWINLDLLVEKFSKNSSTGRTRTIYFTFINLGWILAPTISSYLIKIGTYELTFFIAALLILPIFLIFLAFGQKLNGQTDYKKENIWLAMKSMWLNRNLRGIFFIALLLQIFYSAAVVYIPIYLHQNLGMEWGILGPIFSIMLIPFIIFEIPAGIIADRYWGEKEILNLGLLIMVLSLFLFFYIETPTIWIWIAALFFSRIGASLVEAMRETYFFKLVGAKDVGYIDIFRLSAPLGYIIGPGIAILVLSFFPINYLFLAVAIIMLSGFAFTASIKDTK